ncbi:ABC transporter permease [Oricola sp.]|uniref:ABC transporter permease n=1 Tax=Oricola sp. TaxID=1979950 RepID=UPI0025CFBCB4|nr:ABC transporter permease [Oricola sp.]MCI5075241.1 ABC transporter permease [Oricola sp.]
MDRHILLAPFRLLPRGSVGVLVAITLAAIVVLAVLSALHLADPLYIDPLNRMKPPSAEALFGTDQLGRDIFSRCIYGARVSLFVAVTTTLVTCVVGGSIGLLAGYSPLFDLFGMRFMDALMTMPTILLAIALSSIMGAGFFVVIFAIAVAELPGVSRIVRSAVFAIAAQPYVEAARLNGRPHWQILVVHILPNVLPVILVHATFLFAHVIMAEAALSFLGAGVPPSIPSWGNMIAIGKDVFVVAPWTIVFPGAFVAVTVYVINAVGDHLRERLDPTLSGAFREEAAGMEAQA